MIVVIVKQINIVFAKGVIQKSIKLNGAFAIVIYIPGIWCGKTNVVCVDYDFVPFSFCLFFFFVKEIYGQLK